MVNITPTFRYPQGEGVWARGFVYHWISVVADRAVYTYGNTQVEDKSGLTSLDGKGVHLEWHLDWTLPTGASLRP